MSIAGGIGYALIALGPALSIFITVIAFKPFLVLTLLTSTLVWLVSLIVLAAIWRAFLPFEPSPWSFFMLLLTCVAAQEAIRPMFWKMYREVEKFLDSLAIKLSKRRLCVSDKVQIALAGGLGHGVAHGVFFCLSLLTPAFGPATYYVDSCNQMPLFLVTALISLGFVLIHTFSMIIAFDGYEKGNMMHQLLVPAVHFTASFLTLVNLLPGGCIAGVPLILGSAIFTVLYCAKIVWGKIGQEPIDAFNRGAIQTSS